MPKRILALLCVAIAFAAPATLADEGNGQGGGYLTATTAEIGGTFTVTWGSPNSPGQVGVLVVSDGIGPSTYPSIPFPLCIDVNSAAFSVITNGSAATLGPTGELSLSVSLPNIPVLEGFAPVYLMAAIVDFTVPGLPLSVPKTIRINFANADGYVSSAVGAEGRALHTATLLATDPLSNKQKIFIAGGGDGTLTSPVGTNSTAIYDPLTRTMSVGPTLSIDRALHQSILLQSGKVLVTGGLDTPGNGLTTCEIYDPTTNTMSAAASMADARAGHNISMLSNGNVLVTGGVGSFVGGTTNLASVFNSTVDTAEVYDPNTDTWTMTGSLSTPRFGHTQTVMPNGDVMVTGGINGTTFLSTFISYTNTTDIYNESTGTFSSGPLMNGGRVAHAASLLPNGNLLVTGGAIAGLLTIPTATSSCEILNSSAASNGTAFSFTGSLNTPVATHTQITTVRGDAWIAGGITGTLTAPTSVSDSGNHDGTTYSLGNAIGLSALGGAATVRAAHQAVEMYDGSIVLIGGTNGTVAFADSLVYTP